MIQYRASVVCNNEPKCRAVVHGAADRRPFISYADAKAKAADRGWSLETDRRHYCPKCAKSRPVKEEPDHD